MALSIITYPNEILTQKTKEVTDFNKKLHSILDEMSALLKKNDNGVGLAAPQVGLNIRVTIVDTKREKDSLIELINPTIFFNDGIKVDSHEGCLSIPGYFEIIKRYSSVKVKAQDRHGKEFILEADEFLAIVLQHEIDHLDGILFIDYLSRLKKNRFDKWFKKNKPLEADV